MNRQQLLPLDDTEEKGKIDCNRNSFEMLQSGKFVPVSRDTNTNIFQYSGTKTSTLIFPQLRDRQLRSNQIFKCGERIFSVFMTHSGTFIIQNA